MLKITKFPHHYKKAKEVAKDFVVDDDLKNFGIDDFDLSDIDFDEEENK
ncbi:hypothetical protein [Mycoplasmopsis fermentans]|nr:hypothetical protein [Mycoplasmopsis fermentans]